MTNTDTPHGGKGDVRPQSRNTKAPTTGIVKASAGTRTGTPEHSTPAAANPPREGDGGASERAALDGRDPREVLWTRARRRVPSATREFRRYDRRARRNIFTMSAALATMMLTASVWGGRGGRAAINHAMQLAAKRPRRRTERPSVPRWFLPFGVAFGDGGGMARRMIATPRRMADAETRQCATRAARPKVIARIRRELPEACRHPSRWPWLPFFVAELGAADATLAIRRALGEGLDLGAVERRLIHLWRQHSTRARLRQHGTEPTGAEVEACIAREFGDGGAA